MRRVGHNTDLVGIQVDVDGPLKAMRELRTTQIPYTIARALTMTAKDARDSLRKEEAQLFTLRNDWTQKRTLTEMATPRDLTAQVYTDTTNRKTGAPDYLLPQEEGKVKKPYGVLQWQGVAYIGVPTVYLRALVGPGPVPTWAKPQNLIKGADTPRRTYWSGKKSIENYRQLKSATREWVVNGHVFFINYTSHEGDLALYVRNPGHRYPIQPVYLLIREATIKANLHAYDDIERVVAANFPENFSKAATEVMGNDLLRGSGVSVKL
jgi:hypothetical protein